MPQLRIPCAATKIPRVTTNTGHSQINKSTTTTKNPTDLRAMHVLGETLPQVLCELAGDESFPAT